mgnify:CR=1 FL=1
MPHTLPPVPVTACQQEGAPLLLDSRACLLAQLGTSTRSAAVALKHTSYAQLAPAQHPTSVFVQ